MFRCKDCKLVFEYPILDIEEQLESGEEVPCCPKCGSVKYVALPDDPDDFADRS